MGHERISILMDGGGGATGANGQNGQNGYKFAPLELALGRDLVEEDLDLLEEVKTTPASPGLKRLREKHHAAARAIASGLTDTQAAAICGYTAGNIQMLRRDGMFRALVEMYREQVDAAYMDFHGKLADLGELATDTLADRIEEAPDSVETADLISVLKTAADRSGHGPASTSRVDVTFGIAGKLAEARDRIRARRSQEVLVEDAQVVETEKEDEDE